MHILVTGVAGFIGKQLITYLNDEGHTASGLDRSETIDPITHSILENYYSCNLSAQEIDKKFKKIDVIVHLAGEASVSEKKSKHKKDNIDATISILEFAESHNIKKIIFLSSEKVNNNNSAYAQSKRDAEQLILQKSEATGLHFTILRCALVFGPGMKNNLVGFLLKIKRGKLLSLPSTQSTLSMIGVHDLCRIICACIKNNQTNNKVYKVSDGRSYGINTLEHAVRYQFRLESPKLTYPKMLLFLGGKIGDLSSYVGIKFPLNSNAYAMLFDNKTTHDKSIFVDTGITPRQNYFDEIKSTLTD